MHLVSLCFNFDNEPNSTQVSSIISGYNYDIFISYRQKDNKGDRWVSKFVDALKTELEAAFKEDVSVYFDENPHDRLQETHNVDKSLEGKLKCLIFIPILSQTYCDPNSYAWQNEFLAFLRMIKNDRFGKDIKLKNGNVASRILPIRIHDIDPEDVKMFEKESGSALRALDFVFRTSTGVSRPLKANEDHPLDNLNKTFYGDQINKVGHAIKEIILGLRTEPVQVAGEKDRSEESFKEINEDRKTDLDPRTRTGRLKLLSTFVFIAMLIIASIILYPKIFKRTPLEKLRSTGERIAVAVMPFQNMTNDTTWNVWQEGIQNELITSLTNSEELKVRQTESINSLLQSKGITNYASITSSVAGKISQQLDADIFISGSIKHVGSTLRINAQLIDSKTQDAFKSFQIDGIAENMLHSIDSLSNEVKNFLVISKLEKELPVGFRHYGSSVSLEAVRYSFYGNKALFSRDYPAATDWYLKALAVDSTFAMAACYLSLSYYNQGLSEQAKKWCLEVYKKRDMLPLTTKIMANWLYAYYFETIHEQIKYIKQFLEIEDMSPLQYYVLGVNYNALFQFDNAIAAFEKSLELYNKLGLKPVWVYNYTALGDVYHKTGQYDKEKKLYKRAEADFPDDYLLLYRQARLALSEGKMKEADKYIGKYMAIRKDMSASEATIASSLGDIYEDAGMMDKAVEYYRQALTLEPENPTRMNNLAWFLINDERNVNEGMELIDLALKLSPETDFILDTKGWGLYKQGKFNEALEYLQRGWDVKSSYDHEMFLHLEAAKKAVAGQKNN